MISNGDCRDIAKVNGLMFPDCLIAHEPGHEDEMRWICHRLNELRAVIDRPYSTESNFFTASWLYPFVLPGRGLKPRDYVLDWFYFFRVRQPSAYDSRACWL